MVSILFSEHLVLLVDRSQNRGLTRVFVLWKESHSPIIWKYKIWNKGIAHIPDDSICDLLIPFDHLVGGHLTFERVTFHHPKKGTKNCQVCFFSMFEKALEPGLCAFVIQKKGVPLLGVTGITIDIHNYRSKVTCLQLNPMINSGHVTSIHSLGGSTLCLGIFGSYQCWWKNTEKYHLRSNVKKDVNTAI